MKKDFEKDINMNFETYYDYLDRLKMLATAVFSWEGIEENCGFGSARFLEQALYSYGRCSFIKDDELGYLITYANPSDSLNVYNLATKYNCYSLGYNKIYNTDEICLIFNNEIMKPTEESLRLVAYRLYDCTRTIDINVAAQKTPVLLEGDNKSILTLKNLYQQYSGNSPVLFGNKNFDIANKINSVNTVAPYLADKLNSYKNDIWCEALTFLGINNNNIEKKERLITDEVNANNDLINYYLNCFYKTRKDAAKRINEKFFEGKEVIKVNVNQDYQHIFDDIEIEDTEDLNSDHGDEL